MLSLVKCCSTKRVNQNIYRPFSKFIFNQKYNKDQFKMNRRKNNNKRVLSTNPVLKPAPIDFPIEVKDEFEKFLPVIIKDLTEDKTYLNIPEATKRFSDVLNYHLPLGLRAIGLTTYFFYKMIEESENLTTDNMRLAAALGWSHELLWLSILLTDDLMDNSVTRQNVPCWFRIDGIGMTAVNDALFLQSSAYTILKKYFSTHPKYMKLMETFQEGYLKMIYGQCVDALKPKLEVITMDRFNRIAMYKGSQFALIMPTYLGMHLSNKCIDEVDQVRPILIELGRYMVVENDMCDCYGDTRVTGKIGTDIQEGKCSWLAVVALQEASPSQRKIMEDHYGKPSTESVQVIRKLYDELDILGKFAAFKKETHNTLYNQLLNLSTDNPMCKPISKAINLALNRSYE